MFIHQLLIFDYIEENLLNNISSTIAVNKTVTKKKHKRKKINISISCTF